MRAWDGNRESEYRWINPDYLEKIKEESVRRGVSFDESADGSEFVDLSLGDDILEKAAAMVMGLPYDVRISVELNLCEFDRVMLMELAHEADLSLNQFVQGLLELKVREAESAGVAELTAAGIEVTLPAFRAEALDVLRMRLGRDAAE